MSLTGFPLIVTGVVCTLAAVIATVLLWNRLGRMRHVLRPAGILLAEVLLLVTFGLVVNRSEEFYPTWAALLDTKAAGQAVVQTTDDTARHGAPGALDHQLAVRAGSRTAAAQTFGWQSADWRHWGLAAEPTVVVPPGYLQHPTWSYSVVVVVGAEPAGWRAAEEEAAARRATATGVSAVVVFATPAASAPGLAAALPDQLARDLRVTGHRWAIVTSAADAQLARDAAGAATVRYSSLVVVPEAGSRIGRGGPVRAPAALPPGVTAAVVTTDAAAPRPAGVETLPSTAPDALYTALSWAIERTPPPLAAESPPKHGTTDRPVSPAGSTGPLPPRR